MGAEMNTAYGDPSGAPEEPHPFAGQFEPPAETMAGIAPRIPLSEIAQASSAISLKRIADRLDAFAVESCNDYGETALPALARAIRDGLRGDR